MNKYQLATAYAAFTKHFELRAAQRDAFDRCDDYLRILELVHKNEWTVVAILVQKHNYFSAADPDDPMFELVS